MGGRVAAEGGAADSHAFRCSAKPTRYLEEEEPTLEEEPTTLEEEPTTEKSED